MTIVTADGQTWTYCHLSYVDPTSARRASSRRAPSRPRRLDRPCDRAAPAPPAPAGDLYPQQLPWFQSFAGTAFRWQDAGPTDPIGSRPRGGFRPRSHARSQTEDPVVRFTR